MSRIVTTRVLMLFDANVLKDGRECSVTKWSIIATVLAATLMLSALCRVQVKRSVTAWMDLKVMAEYAHKQILVKVQKMTAT
jgi:hypothetical protein